MTSAHAYTEAVDIRHVEQFLYREARLADEHHYDEWEALWTDDADYWVPAGHEDSNPETQMSVIRDNRHRIATRVAQLKTGKRHSQSPPSRLRRIVSNVEITGQEDEDVLAEANFVLVESRERGNHVWGGRYRYRLRNVDGELRMAAKHVILVDIDRILPTLAFLI